MAVNPIYNILEPRCFDFQNGADAVTFKPGFARKAEAGEKIGNATTAADDLIVTNAGGMTFIVSSEMDKKRWQDTGEARTYLERGKLVSGTAVNYVGPPVQAVRAGENGYMPAPEATGLMGTMVTRHDRIIRDRKLDGTEVHYAMPERQFNAATEPAKLAPAPIPEAPKPFRSL